MAKQQEFKSMDVTEEISARELLRLLKCVVALDENAIVTIRQTTGTDFPPFISVESKETHDAMDNEGVYENLLAS